jgi:methyl-accepting chemotaxis protein
MSSLNEHSTKVRSTSGKLESNRLSVNERMAELGQVASEVTGAMQEINQGVSDINEAMLMVNNLAGELKTAAFELFEEIERFKT